MSEIKVVRHVVAALAVACLLSACSGEKPEAEAPPVASLRTAAPPASAAPTGEDQRPLVPIDATNEERERLQNVWIDCIRKEGGAGYENPKMIFEYVHNGDAKAKKVMATCHPKEPESYEERQQRTDIATFRDNQRQWYKCAQEAGFKLTAPSEDGEFGLTEIGPNGDYGSPKMEACRIAAFKD